jgi:hypothetical protein
MALSKPDGSDAEQIGRDQATKIVEQRSKIIKILESIDAPRAVAY